VGATATQPKGERILWSPGPSPGGAAIGSPVWAVPAHVCWGAGPGRDASGPPGAPPPLYFADMDCIVDDQLWTPRVWEDARALYSWGPPVPPSFLRPENLAALLTGAHDAS